MKKTRKSRHALPKNGRPHTKLHGLAKFFWFIHSGVFGVVVEIGAPIYV